MKIKEIKQSLDTTYVRYMVEILGKNPVEHVKKEGQCASTQAILDRDPRLDEQHFYRSLPEIEKIYPHGVPDPERASVDVEYRKKALGFRDVDPLQVAAIEDIRRKGRNSQGDAVSQGASSVSKETKERAVNAFLFSPPAKLTHSEIKKLTEVKKIEDAPKIIVESEIKKVKYSTASFWFYEVLPTTIAGAGLIYMGLKWINP